MLCGGQVVSSLQDFHKFSIEDYQKYVIVDDDIDSQESSLNYSGELLTRQTTINEIINVHIAFAGLFGNQGVCTYCITPVIRPWPFRYKPFDVFKNRVGCNL